MKSLGEVIEKFLDNYGYAGIVKNHYVLANWEKIVGSEVANHTRPIRIDFGKLYVEVDSPIWRNELCLEKERILRRIREIISGAEIKEIIFK